MALETEERILTSEELTPDDLAQLRAMFAAAWGPGVFTDDDWDHAFGGVHILRVLEGRILSHGAVAERTLWVDGRPARTGYLEAVATWPDHQRRGHASAIMRGLDEIVRRDFDLGGLSTGVPGFYEPFGWSAWRGTLAVRTPNGDVPTSNDGNTLVLPTPRIPVLDLDGTLTCDWRAGDVW